MGYFPTTSPEIEVQEKSPASPKTHTPLPRLQERGHRYYSPEVGKWVSRDPIGERSFYLRYTQRLSAREKRRLTKASLAHPYAFVKNSPGDRLDGLGLVTFEGCTAEQEIILMFDLFLGCDLYLSFDVNTHKCCFANQDVFRAGALANCIKEKCQDRMDYTIKCDPDNETRYCDGNTCAWTVPWGRTIHICAEYSSSRCAGGYPGRGSCIMIHEIAHQCFRTEGTAQKVEKCCDRWFGR